MAPIALRTYSRKGRPRPKPKVNQQTSDTNKLKSKVKAKRMPLKTIQQTVDDFDAKPRCNLFDVVFGICNDDPVVTKTSKAGLVSRPSPRPRPTEVFARQESSASSLGTSVDTTFDKLLKSTRPKPSKSERQEVGPGRPRDSQQVHALRVRLNNKPRPRPSTNSEELALRTSLGLHVGFEEVPDCEVEEEVPPIPLQPYSLELHTSEEELSLKQQRSGTKRKVRLIKESPHQFSYKLRPRTKDTCYFSKQNLKDITNSLSSNSSYAKTSSKKDSGTYKRQENVQLSGEASYLKSESDGEIEKVYKAKLTSRDTSTPIRNLMKSPCASNISHLCLSPILYHEHSLTVPYKSPLCINKESYYEMNSIVTEEPHSKTVESLCLKGKGTTSLEEPDQNVSISARSHNIVEDVIPSNLSSNITVEDVVLSHLSSNIIVRAFPSHQSSNISFEDIVPRDLSVNISSDVTGQDAVSSHRSLNISSDITGQDAVPSHSTNITGQDAVPNHSTNITGQDGVPSHSNSYVTSDNSGQDAVPSHASTNIISDQDVVPSRLRWCMQPTPDLSEDEGTLDTIKEEGEDDMPLLELCSGSFLKRLRGASRAQYSVDWRFSSMSRLDTVQLSSRRSSMHGGIPYRKSRQSHCVIPGKLLAQPKKESLGFRDLHGIAAQECEEHTLSLEYDEDATCDKEYLPITARDVVLQRCHQDAPVTFSEAFSESYLNNCKKIGEGVYGEVFMWRDGDRSSVIKIIPIEGDDLINGERQKKFSEILSEIVITTELSNLRLGGDNQTNGFTEVLQNWCIQDKYPDQLIKLWIQYSEERQSENDCPDVFSESQLFIVIELANGGEDLEQFQFNNAKQSKSILLQTAYALAVAEKSLEFEHRDLHWGNVLISRTKDKFITYKLSDMEHSIPTHGVQVTIIDFTLSRMTYDGCCIFNDLALDPGLFESHGDYQFDIYRKMREVCCDTWNEFTPFTNTLWLHYLVDKMISPEGVHYRNVKTKVHQEGIEILKDIQASLLSFPAAVDFVETLDVKMKT